VRRWSAAAGETGRVGQATGRLAGAARRSEPASGGHHRGQAGGEGQPAPAPRSRGRLDAAVPVLPRGPGARKAPGDTPRILPGAAQALRVLTVERQREAQSTSWEVGTC
jgi:hypothetical protein